jgi:hypothetical protein
LKADFGLITVESGNLGLGLGGGYFCCHKGMPTIEKNIILEVQLIKKSGLKYFDILSFIPHCIFWQHAQF